LQLDFQYTDKGNIKSQLTLRHCWDGVWVTWWYGPSVVIKNQYVIFSSAISNGWSVDASAWGGSLNEKFGEPGIDWPAGGSQRAAT
jgi:hypothetical protein